MGAIGSSLASVMEHPLMEQQLYQSAQGPYCATLPPTIQVSQDRVSLSPPHSTDRETVTTLNDFPEHPGWAHPEQRPPVYTCVTRINRWYVAACVRSNGLTVYQKDRDARVMLQAIQTLALMHGLPHTNYLMLMPKPIITVSERQGKWFPYALYPDRATRLVSSDEDQGFDSREAAEAMAIRMARTKQSSYVASAGIFITAPAHALV